MFKVQSELVDSRLSKSSLEKRNKQMAAEIHELIEKLKNVSMTKNEAVKELEVVKKERNFLSESMKELKIWFDKINRS